VTILFQTRREESFEHLGVQEALVLQSSPTTVTCMLRPDRNRDVLRNLEPEDEVIGHGIKQLGPVLLSGKLVERQVAANRWKDLDVFGKALLLELRVRELAPRHITVLAVDASEPTVVLPRTGAEVDLSIGERA